MSIWKKALATHEEAQDTSTGQWPGDGYHGVALPSSKALWLWVVVRYQDRQIFAQVRDVGPFFIKDDEYVFGDSESMAAKVKRLGGQYDMDPDKPGIQLASVGTQKIASCNGAGIDLMPGTATALGIPINTNVEVEWRFATAEEVASAKRIEGT